DKVHITQPTGGMFAWLTMPEHVDCEAFFEACMDQKVGIITSKAFATDESNPGHSFRLSYTVPSIEEIQKGMKILGELTKEFCD
ncbi:MAG: PLP-dependent aminotransferase family protein, partial [Veillonella sp.]|nr:PLP-dependent aminotransferase family protein [Veillonella sp.]